MVSYHHFGWAFPNSAKSRIDKGRLIALKTRFFDFPHRGDTKKTPLRSNSTRSVSYHHFGWAFPNSEKSRVDEGRPIAFKTRFFEFPHRGETKKHPCNRIPRRRFHTTILGGLFQAAQKAGLTKVVQLRSKRVFSSFPTGAKRKNTLAIQFHEVGLVPRFWIGFQSSAKSQVDDGRPIAFKMRFFDFPHRGETKKRRCDRILRGEFHTTILDGFSKQRKKQG